MGIERRTAVIIAAVAAGGLIPACGLCAAGAALVDNGRDKAKPAASVTVLVTPTSATSTPPPASAVPAAPSSPTAGPATMPAVAGRNAAVVLDDLHRAGITNVQLGSVTAGDSVVLLAANWTVVDQSVPAGAVVQPGQLVVLSCRKNAR